MRARNGPIFAAGEYFRLVVGSGAISEDGDLSIRLARLSREFQAYRAEEADEGFASDLFEATLEVGYRGRVRTHKLTWFEQEEEIGFRLTVGQYVVRCIDNGEN